MIQRLKRLKCSHVLLISIVLISMLGVTCGIAYAYLTATTKPVENKGAIGEQTIAIEENFDPHPHDGKVQKEVRIVNTGTCACYVRALVVPSEADAIEALDLGGNEWSEPDSDGYCYYQIPLNPHSATSLLMSSVVVKNGSALSIHVYAESIQSEGFESAQQAFLTLGGQ